MSQPRTAVQDANAGKINPPSTKYQAGTKSDQSEQYNQLSAGVQSFGEGMGKALTQFMGERAETLAGEQKLQGYIDQGTAEGRENVALNQENTGLSQSLFGKSAYMRGVQQMEAENGVRASELRLLADIESQSNMSSEEYTAYLKKTYAEEVSKYDDLETKAMVTEQWGKTAHALSAKQSENHALWVQMQANNAHRHKMGTQLDIATQYSQTEADLKKNTGIVAQAFEQFKGMSPQAELANQAEVVKSRLDNNNTMAYKYFKDSGLYDNLEEKERNKVDTAVGAMDTRSGNEMAMTVDNAFIQLGGVNTPEEFNELIQATYSKLHKIEGESTLSERAKHSASTQRLRLKKEMDRLIKEASKGMSAKQIKALNATNLHNAYLQKMFGNGSGDILNLHATPKQEQEASDSALLTAVEHTTGVPMKSPKEHLDAIMSGDMEVAKATAKFMVSGGKESTVLNSAIDDLLASTHQQGDGNDKFTEADRMAFGAVDSIVNSDGDKVIDTDRKLNLSILGRAMTANMSKRETQALMDAFEKNKNLPVATTVSAEFPDGIKDFKESYFNKYKVKISDQEAIESMDMYRLGLDATRTKDGAWNMVDQLRSNNTVYWNNQSIQGYSPETDGMLPVAQDVPVGSIGVLKPVPSLTEVLADNDGMTDFFAMAQDDNKLQINNAKYIERSMGMPLPTFFDALSSPHYKPTAETTNMLTVIGGSDKDGNLTPLNKVQGLRIYTKPGQDGLWFTSYNTKRPYFVPTEDLSVMAQSAQDWSKSNEIMKKQQLQAETEKQIQGKVSVRMKAGIL